jgi:O-succinylbenzoic acid--CoA ligase
VEIVGESQFVFVGRIDNVINSGGIKLIPEMIEEKLAHHIGRRYFIASEPDAMLGEKLVLVVEGEPIALAPETFSELDKYEKPRKILFAPVFIETGSGKIKRAETLKSAK